MKVIGITGGIGSGKTTISDMLREEGYSVFDSDKTAKLLCDTDAEIIKSIKKAFGKNIYENKVLNRKKLAQIVFNDKDSLDTLNSIIHPKTRDCMYDFIIEHFDNQICFVESAIMYESKLYKLMDDVISVTAPEEIRIERVIKRDNTTKDKVLNRINNQIDEQERLSKSKYVISTNRPLDEVKENLLRLVQNMKEQL